MGKVDGGTNRKKGKDRLPDWYPLETYGRELTAGEWALEICVRLALRSAYRNSKDRATTMPDGNSPTEAFIALLSDQAQSRKGRSIFGDEINPLRDWPVNVQTAFEAEFAAQLLRPQANPEHIKWAQRLAQRRGTSVEFFVRKDLGEVLISHEGGWDELSPDDGQLWRDVVGPRVPLMVNIRPVPTLSS